MGWEKGKINGPLPGDWSSFSSNEMTRHGGLATVQWVPSRRK